MDERPRSVLDAPAMLAYLHRESGAAIVRDALVDGAVVNVAMMHGRLLPGGVCLCPGNGFGSIA